MATYTPNLNLKKPDYTDLADVADFNANMDIIDGLTQDDIPDGITNKVFTAAEKDKLAGIEPGANKTTIANNLTETVPGKALDATQGKVLAEQIRDISVEADTIPLSPETAALYGLTGDDATVDRAFLLTPKPNKLIQSYTEAGTYNWTAPDLNNGKPYRIGVHIIGGGGSGAAVKKTGSSTHYIQCNGGGSGFSLSFIMYVVPGQTYPVVVGAGGIGPTTSDATASSADEDGVAGGSSSFDGKVANGGEGGNWASSASASILGGVAGGQCVFPSYGGNMAYIAPVAPSKGEMMHTNTSFSRFPQMRLTDALNPFDNLRRLAAGGCVSKRPDDPPQAQIEAQLEDGLSGSRGMFAYRQNVNLVNTSKPSSPGSGGGAALLLTAISGVNEYTCTAASGADGAVFIYV